MRSEVQQQITQKHLSDMSTEGVYTYVAPTITRQGRLQPIANPTDTSFNRQISRVTERLENEGNKLWADICNVCKYDS